MLIQKIANFAKPYAKKLIEYYKSCNEIDKIVLGMVIVLIPSGLICAIINFGLAAVLAVAALYVLIIYLFYPIGKSDD